MIHQRPRPNRFTLSLGLALLLVVALRAQAQQPVIHYVYDDLGRLVGVVDQDGNAATYTYDAVGNILAIGRNNVANTPGLVAITLVAPSKGKVGTAVAIFGKGFSPDAAQNTISFSGAIASVTAASATSLNTMVPPEALTGPITVTTPLGAATSPEPFTVLGVVTISPASAVLFPTQTQQFTATASGTTTPSVTWSANGIVGGDATIGTISATGLYTAPVAVPSPPTLMVRATNTDDPSFSDSATVVIVTLPDKIFAHLVSLGFAAPTTTMVNSLTARAVSVSVATPPSTTVNALTAPAVSVGFAAPTTTMVNSLTARAVSVSVATPPSTTVNALTAPAVSVGFAAPTTTMVNSLTARAVSVSVATPPSTTVNALTAPAVSVGFAASTTPTAFVTASPVGVTLQPVITSVTPSSGARGVAGLSLLLTGAGFAGATSVGFQVNGATDPSLSVSTLAVSPDGTEATFTLAIASGAAPGPRVVRITTPGGTSTASGTGGNLFTVQ